MIPRLIMWGVLFAALLMSHDRLLRVTPRVGFAPLKIFVTVRAPEGTDVKLRTVTPEGDVKDVSEFYSDGRRREYLLDSVGTWSVEVLTVEGEDRMSVEVR